MHQRPVRTRKTQRIGGTYLQACTSVSTTGTKRYGNNVGQLRCNESFLVGQEFTIEIIDYTVTGSVTRLDTAGDALPTDPPPSSPR